MRCWCDPDFSHAREHPGARTRLCLPLYYLNKPPLRRVAAIARSSAGLTECRAGDRPRRGTGAYIRQRHATVSLQ